MANNIALFIQDYQVLISSSVAIGCAYLMVRGNRKTAAMSNTTSILNTIKQDEVMQQGIRYINGWDDTNKTTSIAILVKLKPCSNKDDCDKSQCATEGCRDKYGDMSDAVFRVLNQYEHIAVGIRNNIYNEDIIKESSCNTIVNLVRISKPLIDRCRTVYNRPTIWQEIEELADKWSQKPLKLKKK